MTRKIVKRSTFFFPRLANNPASLQAGNDRLEVMAETKLLDFNLEKSGFMQIGKSKMTQKFKEQLLKNPITLCGKPMSCVNEAKLLGDWLSDKGLAESVATTVKKRKGLVIASIYEIRTVVDDVRSNSIGGLSVALTCGSLQCFLCCCSMRKPGFPSPRGHWMSWKVFRSSFSEAYWLLAPAAPFLLCTGRQEEC